MSLQPDHTNDELMLAEAAESFGKPLPQADIIRQHGFAAFMEGTAEKRATDRAMYDNMFRKIKEAMK